MKKTLAAITLAGSIALVGAVPAMAVTYPAPAPGATVSDGSVDVGEAFVFAGRGFLPNETVTVTVRQGRGNGPIAGTYTATADGNGAFTLSLNLSKPGAFTLTAAGAGEMTASATVNVKGAGVAGNNNGAALATTGGTALATTGGAALANTGADSNLMIWSLVGAGALAAGVTSVVVVRRRAQADVTA